MSSKPHDRSTWAPTSGSNLLRSRRAGSHRDCRPSGASGASALGALLGHQVTSLVASGLARLGVAPSADGASGGIPDVGALPAPVRAVVEDAYGVAVSHVFLVAAPFALLALGAIIAMTEVPLRRTLDLDPADNEPVGANR